MPLRIGIVGAGANTRQRHVPGFRRLPGVEVVAVCNRTEASAARVAAEFGIPRVFRDWRELVHAAEVDAVCIGTWPNMHCPVTLEALAAGKHVLTEARMAASLSDAERMCAAAAAAGDRVAMVVPAPLYLEHEPALLRLLAEGFFGAWLEIHLRGMGGAYDPAAPRHWRQRRDLSGDNVLSLGIFNETVRRYAGDERAVVAHARIFTPRRRDPDSGEWLPVDVPDSLGVVAEMSCGATAVYHLSNAARHGAASALEFHGTRGALRLESGRAWIAGEGDEALRELIVPPAERGGWRVEEEFVDAIRLGTPVTRTSFADGLKYMAFTEAVHRSLRLGRRIELPLA